MSCPSPIRVGVSQGSFWLEFCHTPSSSEKELFEAKQVFMFSVQTPPTYKCPHSCWCYFLSTNWPTVRVLSHCRASSHTAQFPLFSSKQPNATSMAMRKIGVGTLVSVEQESTGHGRRRPSEGGIGFVVKRKKQRRMEDKNGELLW